MPTSDQCILCQHYEPGQGSCAAFPAGIPSEIMTGQVDHTKPYPGDHGIRFEPYEETEE